MPIELTREELFTKVWERPMTKVAADFGISDVALKKICDKHRIPVPGRGYWARMAAGKPVKTAIFRKVADAGLDRIVIRGGPDRNLPKPVRQARQAAKTRESKPENKIEVAKSSGELHPIVARTSSKLSKVKISEKGLAKAQGPTFFNVEVAPVSIERTTTYLNSLVSAIQARGWRLKIGEKGQALLVDGETIEFRIAEKVTRFKHEPTDEEVAALARWEKKRDEQRYRGGYFDWFSRPNPPEWDCIPTGQLRILLNEGVYGYNGLRRSFGDGKSQRIEGLLNSTLEALATWSAAIKTKRIEDENQRKRWAEEEKRNQELRRREVLEKMRVESLATDIERHRQQDLVLNYVAVVEAAALKKKPEDLEAIQEWIEWARGYAARLDPLGERFPRLLKEEDFSKWELG